MSRFPRLRSFRLRMALLSAAISAFVLMAFTGLVFATLQQINVRRLDQDLRELGTRYLSAPPRPDRWERVAESLQFLLGEQSNAYVLLVKEKDGAVAFRSGNWPDTFAPEEFSTEGVDFMPQPPVPWGPGGHGRPGGPGPMEKGGMGHRGFRRGPPPGFGSYPPGPPPAQGDQPPQPPQYPPQGYPPMPPAQGDQPPQPPQYPPQGYQPMPPAQGDQPPQPPQYPPQGYQPMPPAQGDQPPQPPQGFQPVPPGMPMPFRFSPPQIKALQYQTRASASDTWRLLITGTEDTTFVLGLNQGRLRSDMAQVATGLGALVPVALLLIAAGAWILSQRALGSITALTRAVEGITAKGLDQRIDASDVDQEFARFLDVFNAMMDRLDISFKQAVRFSADAAHELKTPLAILQGHLEQAIQAAPPESDEQRRYTMLAAEVQRLIGITRKLLLLARIDAGQLHLNLRPVDLSQMIEAVAEDIEVLAPQLDVRNEIAPGLHVMADPDLLRQVIQNLTSNAIKYNVKGGFVRLMLRRRDDAIVFAIANSGAPIAPGDRERIFERFYRADKAHNRRVDGVGLGLSLAHEIVRAHHGQLILADPEPGTTTFVMILPPAS